MKAYFHCVLSGVPSQVEGFELADWARDGDETPFTERMATWLADEPFPEVRLSCQYDTKTGKITVLSGEAKADYDERWPSG